MQFGCSADAAFLDSKKQSGNSSKGHKSYRFNVTGLCQFIENSPLHNTKVVVVEMDTSFGHVQWMIGVEEKGEKGRLQEDEPWQGWLEHLGAKE